jgi:predicted DCC family thiol-disulfide oxidoreductase YuxK
MHPVVIFDGYCRLCHWSVQFLLRRDHKRLFRFTTLDGKFAQGLPIDNSILANNSSVLLWHKNQLYTESDAVLSMLGLLGGWWKISAAGYILPRFIRNALYKLIAKNRFRVFGKFDTCPLPSEQTAALFFD